MNRLQNFFLIFFIGLVLSFPIVFPYFNSQYFPTHDGEWAVVRAAEMFRELRDMQLPPRFSQALNFGYGYPLFNFAYPGPYYITTFIHALGFNFITSVKIIFAVSVPLSFYGMYLFSSSVFKKKAAGIISGTLYLYLPYRMVDLYVRGSIGESISFVLFPFIFWALYSVVIRKHTLPYVLLGSIFTYALIVSHNIMSVYFGILFLTFLVGSIVAGKIKGVVFSLVTIIWGGLLSAYFIVPALFEKQFIKLSQVPIADRNLYYVTFEKLFLSKWGYGTPTEGSAFPYLIGAPQFIGVFSVFTFRGKKNSFEKILIVSFLTVLIFFIFMMFPVSGFLWRLPLLSEINYPWTLLLPISFLTCFLTGAVTLIKRGIWIGILLVVISIGLYFPFAKPSELVDRNDVYYITNEATTTSSQELMPLWVEEYPIQRFNEKVEMTGDNYATNIHYDSKNISFVAEMKTSGIVTINTIYYPGWKAYTGSTMLPISYKNSRGLMQISLPEGSHNVALHFSETPLRLSADVISIVALLTYFGMLFAIVILQIQVSGKKNKKT